MAVDKLVDSTQLDADLTSVANAIRAKSGGSSQLAFPRGFVSEIGNISTGGASHWDLIGSATLTLSEFTSTTAEETGTDIDISNTDYEFILVEVTCSAAIESATEWGMTVHLVGRLSNGRVYSNTGSAIQQVGHSSLSFETGGGEQVSGAYGLYVANNKTGIVLTRKCDSHITKIRGGTYTVKVYGLNAL